jgi:hypothetical protein
MERFIIKTDEGFFIGFAGTIPMYDDAKENACVIEGQNALAHTLALYQEGQYPISESMTISI